MTANSSPSAIKHIIAVASGKGGVGKSTVAANLALGIAAQGHTVGLLDADIYGPSQTVLFGLHEQPEIDANKKITPLIRYGVKIMSIGCLVDKESPMIWRGPMVSSALQELFNNTLWGELDYLIIDLPPGTGDIQLTLAQKIPVTGAVIVTTPQELALLDARKAIAMFDKVKVPILGIVENMSYHHCQSCGHHDTVFGSGGGEALAVKAHAKLLAQLPLDAKIRQEADSGKPTVVASPESNNATIYKAMAKQVMEQAMLKKQKPSNPFPKIVIEK